MSAVRSRAPVSASVNARSRSRISVSSPAIRMRPIRSGGSARVAATIRSAGGGWRKSRSRSASTPPSRTSWRSSRTSTTGSSSASSALTSSGTTRSTRSGGWTLSDATGSGAPARASASSTPRQKRLRSTSAGSSDSQPSGPVHVRSAAHAPSIALLPDPGGAASSVSGPCSPRSSVATRRGRETHPGGARGGVNFVALSASVRGGAVKRRRGVPGCRRPDRIPLHRSCANVGGDPFLLRSLAARGFVAAILPRSLIALEGRPSSCTACAPRCGCRSCWPGGATGPPRRPPARSATSCSARVRRPEKRENPAVCRASV